MVSRIVREELEKKSVTLKCLNCGAMRITKAGKVEEKPKCHKCKRHAVAPVMKHADEEENKYMAGVLRAYGKRGLYALLVYGVGARTADRVLRKLHKDEDSDSTSYWAYVELGGEAWRIGFDQTAGRYEGPFGVEVPVDAWLDSKTGEPVAIAVDGSQLNTLYKAYRV